jgi:hypothetical protein
MGSDRHNFPLVDAFHAARLGVEAERFRRGGIQVVETPLRLRKQRGYGYVRAAWWLWLTDGGQLVSVPPRTGPAVREMAGGAGGLDAGRLGELITPPVNEALGQAGIAPVDRSFEDLIFACNARMLRRWDCGECRRIRTPDVPTHPGLALPRRCMPDGVLYGVFIDGTVVSYAFSHRTGLMEDRVADLGVATAGGYRRRGHAKTAVSAVVGHYAREGGEARYACSPDNAASAATARSVGFAPYGRSLVLSAPRPGTRR